MAFENNELSMNGHVISNQIYASAVILSSPLRRNSKKKKKKKKKKLILTQKS